LAGEFCFSVILASVFALGSAPACAETASGGRSDAASVKQFGEWFYRCETGGGKVLPGKGAKRCEIFQRERVRRNGEAVTVLSVAVSPDNADKKGGRQSFILTGIAPLNIYLPFGLVWKIDGQITIKMPYRSCGRDGCRARQNLDAKALAAFRNGREGAAQFRLSDGRDVHIVFSLRGFSDALDALQSGGGG